MNPFTQPATPRISARKAKALRARADRNAQWSAQFVKPNGWTVITAEEQKTCPADARITNEERGRLERFEVWRDKPERLAAYYRFAPTPSAVHAQTFTNADHRRGQPTRGYAVHIRTWTGEHLAFGRTTSLEAWQSNMGDWRASVEVTAENGARYVGTLFLSAGDYCRLRLKKGGS